MVATDLKVLSEIAEEIMSLPRSLCLPIRFKYGQVTGTRVMDSRSSAWAEIKECINSNCSGHPVGLKLSFRATGESNFVCNDCINSICCFVYDRLGAHFRVSRNVDPHTWFIKYESGSEAIDFVDCLLQGPVDSRTLLCKCPSGHVLEAGAYIITLEMTFRDATFEVHYYMASND